MTASKAQLRAQAKYDKDNTVQVKIKLNKKTDSDILEILNSVSNKQGYIKELIRIDRIHKLMNDVSVTQLFEN